MGDRETFANELDRLLYPLLFWLDDNGKLSDDPEVPATDTGGSSIRDFGNLRVRMDWGAVDRPGLIYVLRTDVMMGNVLYERYRGTTETLRPGEWVTTLAKEIIDIQVTEQLEAIHEALKKAVRKGDAFTPV